MDKHKHTHEPNECAHSGCEKPRADEGLSRRDFLKSSAAGLTAGTLLGAGLGAGLHAAPPSSTPGKGPPFQPPGPPPGKGPKGGRMLLKGGIVLSLDPNVGDFEEADVLIEGKKILAVGPNLQAAAEVVDCHGMIVMPGFITTHHHQYETVMRAVIPDGLLGGAWPQESYGSVVQNIWTAGRIGSAADPVWDLGRPPLGPEDCYIGELVASLSQITQGITMSCDTSQSSHTPDHTDAMIQGLMDSGARALYDYSGGTNRSAQFPDQPFEFPWPGLPRIAEKYFSSDDQLVTLGFAGGPGVIPNLPPPYTGLTGWQLGREFGAFINNHNVGNPGVAINNVDQLMDPNIGPYLTLVHCVRWQDEPIAQISHSHLGYPNPATSQAMQIFADAGAHVSIAPITEMQMRHGMPPFQLALNYGILPSLSPDVDTNNTPDPFSLMRSAFTLQRSLANDLAFPISNPGGLPVPQLLTARQVIEMATIAGAAGNGVLHKVGTLTPGKEADIIMLNTRNINTAPMNNVPGTIVTMMDTRHVQHVMIAGKFVLWNYALVGWDADKLVHDIEASHERVLGRIQGPALVGEIPPGNNSFSNPYRPNFLDSCCYNGQNTTAPHYVLRP